jgi:uncharacterized RDD family membrane protein YckC
MRLKRGLEESVTMYEDRYATVAVEPAGFMPRLLAWVIDALVLSSLSIALNLTVGGGEGIALALGLGVVYTVGLWWATGATLGKAVMGLKVIAANGYERIDGATAVLRYVGYIVSALPLYLGFFWIAVDPTRQGWHDKIAKTRVVRMR